MVCVVHTFSVIDDTDWDSAVAACKQMWDYEKRVFGQQMTFMRATTGDTSRVMVMGFFESKEAHDEYAKREKEDPDFKALFEAAKKASAGVLADAGTEFYRVVE